VLVAAAHDAGVLQRPGHSGDATAQLALALAEVRDEIDRVLAEGLVAGARDVRRALRSGAGWPDEVLDNLHSW
jgi:hypothetical protein